MKVFLFIFLFSLLWISPAFSFWIWTPETNRWVNPKYGVKDTPAEQLEYALEFFESRDWKRALGEMNKIIKYYPRAREAAEAQFYIGQCWEALNRPLDAFKAYQEVMEKYPFSERSVAIVERQYQLGNDFLLGRQNKNGIVAAITGSDYNVVEIFRTVINNSPYGPYAAPSQYKIGLFLKEGKLFQEARDEFEKVINDYPDSEWAKAARYQVALADAQRSVEAPYDQRITQSAKEEFNQFVKEFPDAEFSQEATEQIQKLNEKEAENQFMIAQFYEKQKKYDAAKIYYNTVVEKYRNSSWAALALKKIQELSYYTR